MSIDKTTKIETEDTHGTCFEDIDEEECDEIVIEFEGNFDITSVDNKDFKFLGLDTDEPILQIGQTFYKAKFHNTIGTSLIFECDKERKLKYLTKSDKKIIMKRVFLKPKVNQQQRQEDSH